MSNIKLNYNLSKNSWFGLGGAAKKYFSPSNEDELIDYLKNNLDEKLITIGSGSNILFRDKGCLETIVKLGKEFQKIEIKNEKIYCGAAALKSQLSKFAYENSIKNYEFLSCIPGTVGGGVIMNAGCFNFEFKDIVIEVEGISKKGDKIYMQNKEIEFDYRKTNISEDIIITKIIFNVFKGDKNLILEKTEKLKNKKSISQPSKIKTGGSTFKNPNFSLKAWELIKKTGCDKKIIGNAKFSESHCNFIENNGTSSKDVEDLIHFTISEVRKKFNITLEPEIKIIGKQSQHKKLYYTLVLKSHIKVSNFNLKKNTLGKQIDLLARKLLKLKKLDYNHGTGHGVGYLSNVHEHPPSISKYSNTKFYQNQVISNEPGYYKDNQFGIRLENLIFINRNRKFENLTLVPFDNTMIIKNMLSSKEKAWINEYHEDVFEKINKFLTRNERSYLRKLCLKIN